MPTVSRTAAARRDLIAHYIYLTENAGADTANRFIANTESSFHGLAEQPGIGAPLSLRNPRLAGIRKWRVSGFDNFLIFYLPRSESISIVRVLHAAQDWWRVLGMTR